MKNKRNSGRGASALLGLMIGAIALFFGLLIGAELHLLIVAFTLLLLAVPLLYWAFFGFRDTNGWLLFGAFGLMYLTFSVQSKGIPIGYLMEAAIFGFLFSALRVSAGLARQDAALRVAAGLLLAYLALLGLSSFLGRSQTTAALWQLQYNLKLPLMFALGTLLVHSDALERNWRRIVALSWLFFVPFLVLEVAAPGTYANVVGYKLDQHVNPLLGFGARLQGPFAHGGYLALVGGLLAAAAAIQWLQGRGAAWLALAVLYTGLVVLSGQRQELAALMLVYALFVVLGGRGRGGWLALAAVLALLVGAAFWLTLDVNPLAALQLEWGGRDSQLSERGILTRKGLEVADQYFPLGSGLGTYGGAGAQKFDQSLFIDLGFSRYWWFRQGLFIVDTFWPSIVAEGGYGAALLLLALFATLWLTLWRRTVQASGAARGMLMLALAALTLVLANSPTSAVLGDPRGSFVFWLIIGCAWRMSVVSRATPAEQLGHNPPHRYSPSHRPHYNL